MLTKLPAKRIYQSFNLPTWRREMVDQIIAKKLWIWFKNNLLPSSVHIVYKPFPVIPSVPVCLDWIPFSQIGLGFSLVSKHIYGRSICLSPYYIQPNPFAWVGLPIFQTSTIWAQRIIHWRQWLFYKRSSWPNQREWSLISGRGKNHVLLRRSEYSSNNQNPLQSFVF